MAADEDGGDDDSSCVPALLQIGLGEQRPWGGRGGGVGEKGRGKRVVEGE